MSHPRRRASARLTPLTAFALLAACGAPGTGSGGGTDGSSSTAAPAAASDTEYTVSAFFIETPDGGPQLCLGGVNESYPPQCGGPTLVNLDWDDVADRESASGVTWGSGYAVGTYDGETFTLTRPVAAEAPDGADVGGSVPDFPPLCADPFRGGDNETATDSPEMLEAQNALQETAQALPGYVASYVSDGAQEFNVIVSTAEGDADAAHTALREVWPGWLCVVEQDLPTASDVASAQDAVWEVRESIGVLSSGSGADGVLDLTVTLADDATIAAVHDAVAPWLTPDQVRVAGVLQPLS